MEMESNRGVATGPSVRKLPSPYPPLPPPESTLKNRNKIS
jgi:hypothetical protein